MADAEKYSSMALSRLASAASEHIVQLLSRSGEDPYAAFGERGREFCRQDTQAHIEMLDVALRFGGALAFRQYVQWLGRVLKARRLSASHLAESLRHLAGFLGAGLPEVMRPEVVALVEAGIRALEGDEDVPEYAIEPVGHDPAAEVLAETLLRGDAARAHALLLDWSRGAWLPEVVVRIVRPAMWRIGWWWQEGRISVAEEHLATEIAHRAVDNAFTHADRKPRRQRVALFACVEGNRHALGLRTVADAFDIEGWIAYNLGADVPLSALPRMVAAFRPELVGLSVSMAQQLPAARAAIDAIHEMQGAGRIRIMLGGLASNSLEEAWHWVGADLAAPDAVRAIEAA